MFTVKKKISIQNSSLLHVILLKDYENNLHVSFNFHSNLFSIWTLIFLFFVGARSCSGSNLWGLSCLSCAGQIHPEKVSILIFVWYNSKSEAGNCYCKNNQYIAYLIKSIDLFWWILIQVKLKLNKNVETDFLIRICLLCQRIFICKFNYYFVDLILCSQ